MRHTTDSHVLNRLKGTSGAAALKFTLEPALYFALHIRYSTPPVQPDADQDHRCAWGRERGQKRPRFTST